MIEVPLLIPPAPTWWLLVIAGAVSLTTALPVIHAWVGRARFPAVSYGGADVPERTQARVWRLLLLGAVGLAALGVGDTHIAREQAWKLADTEHGAPRGQSISVGLYAWSVVRTIDRVGVQTVTQVEELALPWPLLLAVALYWFEVRFQIGWRED